MMADDPASMLPVLFSMPVAANLMQAWSIHGAEIGQIVKRFSPVLDFLKGRANPDTWLTRDDFQEAAKLAASLAPDQPVVPCIAALGSWAAELPFELPALPRSLWRAIDFFITEFRICADDLRIMYANSEQFREPINKYLNEEMPDELTQWTEGVEGIEAYIAIGSAWVGIAEFVGKHPPDHVIRAIAAARGVKFDTLDEQSRFTIKCMLAHDPMLRGTPWEQTEISANGWSIGIKEVVLIYSIFKQIHGSSRLEIAVRGGVLADLEIVPADRILPAGTAPEQSEHEPLPPSDGPFAKKRFRWEVVVEDRVRPIPAGSPQILRAGLSAS